MGRSGVASREARLLELELMRRLAIMVGLERAAAGLENARDALCGALSDQGDIGVRQ